MSDGDSQRRRPGRPSIPLETQRARLLDAAERVFEVKHYEGTTVQAVVREAGMSSRSFYDCFDSKADLAATLARDRAELFLTQMAQVLSSATDLTQAVDHLLRTYLEVLPVVVIDLEHLGGEAGERVREVRDEYRDKIRGVLVGAIDRLASEGRIEDPPDPLAIELIIAGIEAFSIRYHHSGARDDLIALHPRLLSAIRGLFPDLLT